MRARSETRWPSVDRAVTPRRPMLRVRSPPSIGTSATAGAPLRLESVRRSLVCSSRNAPSGGNCSTHRTRPRRKRQQCTAAAHFSPSPYRSACLLGIAAPAAALSRADIEKHQDAADAARKKAAAAEKTAKQARRRGRGLDQRIEKLQGEADALTPKIAAAPRSAPTSCKARLRRLKYECESTQAEIDKTQAAVRQAA